MRHARVQAGPLRTAPAGPVRIWALSAPCRFALKSQGFPAFSGNRNAARLRADRAAPHSTGGACEDWSFVRAMPVCSQITGLPRFLRQQLCCTPPGRQGPLRTLSAVSVRAGALSAPCRFALKTQGFPAFSGNNYAARLRAGRAAPDGTGGACEGWGFVRAMQVCSQITGFPRFLRQQLCCTPPGRQGPLRTPSAVSCEGWSFVRATPVCSQITGFPCFLRQQQCGTPPGRQGPPLPSRRGGPCWLCCRRQLWNSARVACCRPSRTAPGRVKMRPPGRPPPQRLRSASVSSSNM